MDEKTKIITIAVIISVVLSVIVNQVVPIIHNRGVGSKAGFDASAENIVGGSNDPTSEKTEQIKSLASAINSKDASSTQRFVDAYNSYITEINNRKTKTGAKPKPLSRLGGSGAGLSCSEIQSALSEWEDIIRQRQIDLNNAITDIDNFYALHEQPFDAVLLAGLRDLERLRNDAREALYRGYDIQRSLNDAYRNTINPSTGRTCDGGNSGD